MAVPWFTPYRSPGERANAWRNPLAPAPMMGASYLDDLAAQVAEKRRAQESEKLRDRAANLQHMGAAPFTGGPIAGGPANGFLAEQGARVERAQAELGDAPRPRGGAQQHGTLQAAQPLDPGRMNGLFGAPRARARRPARAH